MVSVGSVEVQLQLAQESLDRGILEATKKLKDISDTQININVLGDEAFNTINQLEQQILKAQAALTDDAGAAAELERQAAFLGESLRFKQQLAEIEGAGFSDQDLNQVKQFALELNGLNVDRIAKDFDRLEKQIEEAAKELGIFDSFFQGIGQGIGQRALDTFLEIPSALQDFANEAIAVARANKGVETTLDAVLGSATAVGEQLDFIREVADDVGGDATTLGRQFANLLAATETGDVAIPIQDVQDVFAETSRVARVLGSDQEQLNNVLLALTQIASKGTVSMEELRQQLGEGLPVAINATAQGLGITIAELEELVTAGELTANEFFPAFASGLQSFEGEVGEAGKAIGQLGNVIGDFQDVGGRALIPIQTAAAELSAELLAANFDNFTAFIDALEVGVKNAEILLPAVLGLVAGLNQQAIATAAAAVQTKLLAAQQAIASGNALAFAKNVAASTVRLGAFAGAGASIGLVVSQLQAMDSEAAKVRGSIDRIASALNDLEEVRINLSLEEGDLGDAAEGVEAIVERNRQQVEENFNFFDRTLNDFLESDFGEFYQGIFSTNEASSLLDGVTAEQSEDFFRLSQQVDGLIGQYRDLESAGLGALPPEEFEAFSDVIRASIDELDAFESLLEVTEVDRIDLLSTLGEIDKELSDFEADIPVTVEPTINLDELDSARAILDSEIAQSQNAQVAAIRESQLAGVRSASDAAAQVARIEQDAINQSITARRNELAEIESLKLAGAEVTEEVALRELELNQEIGKLNIQRLESEIEARQRAVEAQINEQFLPIINDLELNIQVGGDQLTQLATQLGFLQSTNELEEARLDTRIAIAQLNDDDAAADALREQSLDNQSAAMKEQQTIARQQLALEQEIARIEAERSAASAQFELARAQAEGSTQAELNALQAIADLENDRIDSLELIQSFQSGTLANQELIEAQQIEQQRVDLLQEAQDREEAIAEERRRGFEESIKQAEELLRLADERRNSIVSAIFSENEVDREGSLESLGNARGNLRLADQFGLLESEESQNLRQAIAGVENIIRGGGDDRALLSFAANSQNDQVGNVLDQVGLGGIAELVGLSEEAQSVTDGIDNSEALRILQEQTSVLTELPANFSNDFESRFESVIDRIDLQGIASRLDRLIAATEANPRQSSVNVSAQQDLGQVLNSINRTNSKLGGL
ncbi:MAG: tape measure protein [Cyanobacteria bacterium P01_E01_bin.6]